MEIIKPKYIFDLGANIGQNLEYYLSRADVVVAVEANPVLCAEIRKSFDQEINFGRLFVENYVLTDNSDQNNAPVDFFVHNKYSVFSRLEVDGDDSEYTKVKVLSTTASEIISKYLPDGIYPYYVKIDVEGYDARILRELFRNEIYPEFISAEGYEIETLAALINSGAYCSYSTIEGKSVHQLSWLSDSGIENKFIHHSAGPFGFDIRANWYNSNTFFEMLTYEKLGWKDLHASKSDMKNVKSLGNNYLLVMESKNLIRTLYHLVFSYRWRKHISRFLYLSGKLFNRLRSSA